MRMVMMYKNMRQLGADDKLLISDDTDDGT